MNELIVSSPLQFDGNDVTPISYKGKPVWIVKQVGAALDYAEEGRSLVRLIGSKWKGAFIESMHYIKTTPAETAFILGSLDVTSKTTSRTRTPILLLTEEGFELLKIKSSKPALIPFQQFLAKSLVDLKYGKGALVKAVESKRLDRIEGILEALLTKLDTSPVPAQIEVDLDEDVPEFESRNTLMDIALALHDNDYVTFQGSAWIPSTIGRVRKSIDMPKRNLYSRAEAQELYAACKISAKGILIVKHPSKYSWMD